MTNKQTTPSPLWRELKSKITPGEWMIAENHLNDQQHTQSVLSNGSTLVADFMRHNFKKVGKSKFKTKSKLFPCKEAKANAEYTILAVKNLASLAEALEGLIHSIEHEGEIHGRIVCGLRNAKEAIAAIS